MRTHLRRHLGRDWSEGVGCGARRGKGDDRDRGAREVVLDVGGRKIPCLALTVALLHVYDHMYRVKRGPERLFFLPQKEAYGCQACK